MIADPTRYYFFWVSCTRTFENPLFSHSQLSQGVSEARLKGPTLQVLHTRAIFLRLSSSDDLVSSTSRELTASSIVFYISRRVVGQFLLSSCMHPHSQQLLVRGREIRRLGGPGPVRVTLEGLVCHQLEGGTFKFGFRQTLA